MMYYLIDSRGREIALGRHASIAAAAEAAADAAEAAGLDWMDWGLFVETD